MGDQAPLILSDIVGPKVAPHSIAALLTTSTYAGKFWITILGGGEGFTHGVALCKTAGRLCLRKTLTIAARLDALFMQSLGSRG